MKSMLRSAAFSSQQAHVQAATHLRPAPTSGSTAVCVMPLIQTKRVGLPIVAFCAQHATAAPCLWPVCHSRIVNLCRPTISNPPPPMAGIKPSQDENITTEGDNIAQLCHAAQKGTTTHQVHQTDRAAGCTGFWNILQDACLNLEVFRECESPAAAGGGSGNALKYCSTAQRHLALIRASTAARTVQVRDNPSSSTGFCVQRCIHSWKEPLCGMLAHGFIRCKMLHRSYHLSSRSKVVWEYPRVLLQYWHSWLAAQACIVTGPEWHNHLHRAAC